MTQCLQSFGGYGYMEEYNIARMFRDSRILTIGGGSSEIMREIIAKMVIDDVSYQSAAKMEPKAAKPSVVETATNQEKSNLSTKNNSKMSLETILSKIQDKAATVPAIGKTLKISFEESQLHIDGTGSANVVTTEDKDADCSVKIAFDDFMSLLKGELNPMAAMMSGKLKIKGDMGVAMKLQSLLS
jgi:hypothetical protein